MRKILPAGVAAAIVLGALAVLMLDTGAAVPTTVLTATDFAIDGPTTVRAGVQRIGVENDGAQVHHVQLMRLADGKSMDDFEAAMAESEAALFAMVEMTGGVGQLDPGASDVTVADLAPGSYVMMCFLPDPADGAPHFAKGMVSELTVLAEENPAVAPEVDGDITLDDFSVELPEGFDGKGTFAVTNDGEQIHEANLVKLDEGATLEDLLTAENPFSLDLPVQRVGGIQAFNTGGSGTVELDLAPGKYAWICWVPDETGTPHVALGMVAEFEVE